MKLAMNDEPWYGVRCLFVHRGRKDAPPGFEMYEERIVLVRASSFDEAIERAEAEAARYVEDLGDAEYLGDAEAFHVFGSEVGDLTEVFSSMRDSDLDPDAYVRTFFQTGRERARD
jgi:hypothetical protein